MKLFIRAVSKFIIGFIILALFLFLPAGTFAYAGAWIFLSVLFVPMLILGIILFFKSPALLEKRLDAKEKEAGQKGVLILSAIAFIGGFVISALDFRFSWSSVPLWLVIASAALFLFGYGLYAEVMRENAYLSRTVKVEENQRVVSTGLYGVVRHPMYLATLLMFLPIPLILGSYWALIPLALYPVIIVFRIIGEERLLTRELYGYTEYKAKVKYRLIPFIW